MQNNLNMEQDPQENQGRTPQQMEDSYKIMSIVITTSIVVIISLLIIGV